MKEKEIKLDTAPYKGVRDFYPEDKFIQNHIFSVWRKAVESFGYEEYDASILEPTEIFKEKSGDEIVKEQTFTFTDRGGRNVTLRPEMTPTLARMIAGKRRELGFPLRWYSIPNLFRYEAPQRGRLREHWQLNADIFGIENINADIEMILLACKIMKIFGANETDYEIRLNSIGKQSDLDSVVKTLEDEGVKNTKIDTSLARGQTYYNGVVFEFFDTNSQNPRSILGGGRYDGLTSLFGDNTNLAAVGFGAGDVTIKDFLETHNLIPSFTSKTSLYVAITNISLADEARKFANNLTDKNINVFIDWSDKKIGDQIKNADKHKIKFLTVLGEDEIANKKYKVKNLQTGDETELNLEEIAPFLLGI